MPAVPVSVLGDKKRHPKWEWQTQILKGTDRHERQRMPTSVPGRQAGGGDLEH